MIREQSMEICGLNGEGECILYDYDAEGRLVRERSNGWGSCDNGQGLFSNCQTYTYDAYGNLTSRQADDCLGRNPYSTIYTYQCTPKAAPAL